VFWTGACDLLVDGRGSRRRDEHVVVRSPPDVARVPHRLPARVARWPACRNGVSRNRHAATGSDRPGSAGPQSEFTMVEVSILIVCYKSKSLIEACLDGVFAHTRGMNYEILLLDCSND